MRVEHHLHVVEVAHAHAAAGDQRVARPPPPLDGLGDRGLVVARRGRGRRRRSRPARRSASSMCRFESRIWPGRERPAAFDQLVAGREHADPGPRVHRRRSTTPRLASTPRCAGRSTVPARTRRSPRATSLARRPHVVAAARPASSIDAPSSSAARSCLDHHHRVGAAGIGAPVMIRTAWPAPTVDGRVRRRRRACRRPRGAPASRPVRRRVGGPHREPSIAVLANGRHRLGRDDAAPTSTQPSGVGERQRLGCSAVRQRASTHARASLERDHVTHAARAWRGRPGTRGTPGPRSSRSSASSTVARR